MARGAEPRVAFVRAALRDDRLRLLAQPIVELRSGLTVADELLLRFVLPNGRLALPAPYIRAAERYRLAVELDAWVVERAARLAASGRDVHVNLSARTLAEPGFADTVEAALARAGAPAWRITFDIGESSPTAAALRELGAHLALDHFDSLADLLATPVSMLKIDRRLVADIVGDERTRAVVESVASLASRLGHTTLATGVEDESTRGALLDCGVELGQGFALGLPQRLG